MAEIKKAIEGAGELIEEIGRGTLDVLQQAKDLSKHLSELRDLPPQNPRGEELEKGIYLKDSVLQIPKETRFSGRYGGPLDLGFTRFGEHAPKVAYPKVAYYEGLQTIGAWELEWRLKSSLEQIFDKVKPIGDAVKKIGDSIVASLNFFLSL